MSEGWDDNPQQVRSRTFKVKEPRRTLRRRDPKKAFKKDRIYYYDIESWGLNPALDPPLICVVPEHNYTRSMTKRDRARNGYIFRSVAAFTDWLDTLPKTFNHTFYAHNGNNFDIYSFLTAEGIVNSKKLASDTRIFDLTLRPGVHFRDSYHLLSVPLRALGSKGITPEKFIDPEHPDFGNPDSITDEDVEYCVQDCRVLRDALVGLRSAYREWVNHPSAALPLTAAGMAFEVWCATSWDERNWSYLSKSGERRYAVGFLDAANNAARRAYYGGRTQVMDGYEGVLVHNVMSFDRNSMYPAVMRNQRFPDPNKVWRVDNPTIDLFERQRQFNRPYWGKFHLVAGPDAELFLPVFNGDKTDYSQTDITGYYCSPEVNYALEHGWELREVHEMYYTTTSISPFEGYVDHFYNMRLEMKANNDPREVYVKLLLNSLYGKFGSRDRPERVEDPGTIESLMDDDGWEDEWLIKPWSADPTDSSFYLVSIEDRIRPTCVFMPWAAFITSYARVNLQRNISASRAAGLEVVYCDTDSIHICNLEEDTPVPMPLSGELGAWGREQPRGWTSNVVPQARYWERKAYLWLDHEGESLKVKHKGANQSNGDLTTPQRNVSVQKYRSAKRLGIQAGVQVETVKKSRKWCK